jgi:RNA polymerase sigma factor (sigma-70 family)
MVEMHDTSDARLLRDYSEHGSEAAFRDLVTRHADLVYSAALRQVNSNALACDLAQAVFTDLARKAPVLATGLTPDSSLAGWLCRSTRYAVLNHLRDDRRRITHERQAMEQLLTNTEPAPDWDRIRPLLDEALDDLDDEDREAIVLRYFKNQDYRAVGLALGVSDDTAQKRVSRAVERLRGHFSKRNVTVGAGALAAVISANAIQAAPVGLVATLSATALLAGTAVQTSTLIAATKTIVMTTLQKIAITATLAALTGAGIYEARQVSQLRSQVQTLQQAQAPLNSQIDSLEADNTRLSNQVAQARDRKGLIQSQLNELLKLRGQTGQTQTALKELAKAQAVSHQNTAGSAFLTNAMAQGMAMSEKFQKKSAAAKLTRMKDKLNLTDDQVSAINDIMMQRIDANSQRALAAISGQPVTAPEGLTSEDADIQAQLTPDQLAAYPDFKQSETVLSAENGAKSELGMMENSMDLSPDQQDKVQAALYQYNLNQSADPSTQSAVKLARANGNLAEATSLEVDIQKQSLQDKLHLLHSGAIKNVSAEPARHD